MLSSPVSWHKHKHKKRLDPTPRESGEIFNLVICNNQGLIVTLPVEQQRLRRRNTKAKTQRK